MEKDIYSVIMAAGPKIKDILSCKPDSENSFVLEFVRRDIFVDRFSWAVPNKQAILEISKFIGNDTCLEIGAGLGLWSYLLQQEKVNIIAVDNQSDGNITGKQVQTHKNKEMLSYLDSWGINKNIFTYQKKHFTKVENINGLKALEKYKTNCLMLCWSRIDPISHFTGNKIIYIGEAESGFTKGIPNDKEWKLIKLVDIPNWIGVYDFVALYERKTTNIWQMD